MFTYTGKKALSKPVREQFLELQQKVGENTVIFLGESAVGLNIAYTRAGLELLIYAYAENPQLVSDWLEALNWAEIKRVHETANPDLSPVVLVFCDIAGTEQLLFSPRFLRKEFFPRLTKLVNAWHEHGIKVIYHSDGNLWAVLEDLRQAGVDGINPLEPLSKMYAGEVRRACPDWTLMGGIDVSQLLPFGSESEVRETIRKTIHDAGASGRLCIGSTTQIHPGAKLENVLAMWDEVEKSGYYDS